MKTVVIDGKKVNVTDRHFQQIIEKGEGVEFSVKEEKEVRETKEEKKTVRKPKK